MWIETQASVQSFFQKLNVDNSCQKNTQIQILHFIQILYYIILFRYFIKSCPILLYFFTLCLIFCLSKQIFIRNLSQSPSRLNVWILSVTSKNFSNHDKNIMQVSCVKNSRFLSFVLALFCILGLCQNFTLENFQLCQLVVF